jgi:UDP-N-acetylglucosamine 2-epimerase (non-hydrolysing)
VNVLSVVGVRPEFVMAAPVVRALEGSDATLVHTGQHHDERLSEVFVDDLGLPEPDHELGVRTGSRGERLAAMTDRTEAVLNRERPDAVVVYGDTDTTLAGTRAAAATGTPLAHVEAGVRSFDASMPEERNRLRVDRLADLLLAPTQTAVETLRRENVRGAVRLTGDVRRDALALVADADADRGRRRNVPGATDDRPYVLATVHRRGTVADGSALRSVFAGLGAVERRVVVPLHPHTERRLRETGRYEWVAERVDLRPPVRYPEFVRLLDGAACVATDSGGVQREAATLGTPCVTLRERTEWPETVSAGRNVLVGTDRERVRRAVEAAASKPSHPACRSPDVAPRIVEAIADVVSDDDAVGRAAVPRAADGTGEGG